MLVYECYNLKRNLTNHNYSVSTSFSFYSSRSSALVGVTSDLTSPSRPYTSSTKSSSRNTNKKYVLFGGEALYCIIGTFVCLDPSMLT